VVEHSNKQLNRVSEAVAGVVRYWPGDTAVTSFTHGFSRTKGSSSGTRDFRELADGLGVDSGFGRELPPAGDLGHADRGSIWLPVPP
jgi:hypothetical protein